MIEVTRLLMRWLVEHDIPLDGVKVIIEMPDIIQADRVERAIERDLKPMDAFQLTQFDKRAKIEKMNGIGLSVVHR